MGHLNTLVGSMKVTLWGEVEVVRARNPGKRTEGTQWNDVKRTLYKVTKIRTMYFHAGRGRRHSQHAELCLA